MQSISVAKKIQPPVIAHRGASAQAPENTLIAFRRAKEMGARWVEFDVMLTADGEAVVIHDETVDRTTNGVGRVEDFSCSDLQKLDAGSWFSAEFAGEKIPTLLEVIELLNELQLMANIEIKPCVGREKETVERVLQIVAQHWRQKNPPLISSFSRDVLYDVRALAPESVLGFLMHEWQADWQVECDTLQCVSVHVNEKILTREKVREIKESGRLMLVYTVDDSNHMRELFEWGVDAVFSNCPVLLSLPHSPRSPSQPWPFPPAGREGE